jgi:hypothetical protein
LAARVKSVGVKSCLEIFEKEPTIEAGEDSDGEEKMRSGTDPASMCRETTAWGAAVYDGE